MRGDTVAVKCDFCGKNGARHLMNNGAWVCKRCVKKLGGFRVWDDKIKMMGRSEAYETIFGSTETHVTGENEEKRINPIKVVTILVFIAVATALIYSTTIPNNNDGDHSREKTIAAVVVVLGTFGLAIIGIFAFIRKLVVHMSKARELARIEKDEEYIRRKEELDEKERSLIEYYDELIKKKEELDSGRAEFDRLQQQEYNRRMQEEYEKKRRAEEEERRHWKTTDQMTGIQFEQYCAMELKRDHGFVRVEFTRTSGDYGGDLVGYHRDGKKWVIQCKRYSGHVGIDAVQEVLGAQAMYDADRMAVMTNSVLTASARELARKTGVVVRENIKGSMRID